MMIVSVVQTLSIVCCVQLCLMLLPKLYSRALFPWHPLFMGIGFLGFMCEGILMAYKARSLDGAPRLAVLQQHMKLQIVSTVCVVLGFSAIYMNKDINNKNHFTSLHGKMGLITTFFSVFTTIFGTLNFRQLGFLMKFPEKWHAFLKWFHRYIGITTFMLALFVMQLDLPHPSVMEGFVCRFWQSASMGLGIAIILLLRLPPLGKPVLPVMNQAMVPQDSSDIIKHL